MIQELNGSFVALVTPMESDGAIDYASLDSLIDWHIDQGTNGIVSVGTTGESATVILSEHIDLIQHTVKHVNKRVPVIAGTGANSTLEAIELTKEAERIGADFALIVTPYYNKPSQNGLIQHYTKIADCSNIPQILYNVPSRTSCDLIPQTVNVLSEHKNIIGIKEAVNDKKRINDLIKISLDNQDFKILSGDDPSFYEFLKCGGHGVISVAANVIPESISKICSYTLNGDEVGIPLFFLGKAARSKGVTVVQVGEGADELFYGYNHWLRFLKVNKYFKPLFKSQSQISTFSNHRINLISNIIFGRTSFAGGALGFNLSEINNLVDGGIPTESKSLYHVESRWNDYFSRDDAKLSKWMTLIDLDVRLPELLLMRMDKLVMQSGVETRVPFLDHKLVEFVLTLPESVLVDKKETKPLLKSIARNHIPNKIVDRSKQGFRAPIGEWIKKDLDYFYESVKIFNEDTNLFKQDSLKKVLNGSDFQKKWYLINLSQWHTSRSNK